LRFLRNPADAIVANTNDLNGGHRCWVAIPRSQRSARAGGCGGESGFVAFAPAPV
jgi:hypothetical protein